MALTGLETESDQKVLDRYLVALRRHLRDLREEDIRDIVEEIRMHVVDKTQVAPGRVAAALAALGSPAELAERYCTPEMLERARGARTPKQRAWTAARWSAAVLGGLLAFCVSAIGYVLGGGLFLLALMKIDKPGKTGVFGQWTEHTKSFSFQSGGPNAPHDLLGWWLVPLGLVVGGGLLVLTYRFTGWAVRRIRGARRVQEA